MVQLLPSAVCPCHFPYRGPPNSQDYNPNRYSLLKSPNAAKLTTLLNYCYTALHKRFNVKVSQEFSIGMLLLTVIVVVALVAWALRLMEQAVKSQEFSFMLAGFLVASSAVAMMTVYFLMSNYVLYLDQTVSGTTLRSASFVYEGDAYAYRQPLVDEGGALPIQY